MTRPRPTWSAAMAAVGSLPIVVATVRALARGWLPMGDNAYFSIRARDVLTAHHPLVGAWSSGSQSIGVDVNNLGPLQLDLLALPVRIGWAAGTAVGTAAINVAAVVLAVVVAGRAAGRLGAATVAAMAAALSWTMGSELLFEPRQHHALLLPFLCLLVLVWALTTGWSAALPFAAGAATLLVQTHLSYPLLVLVLCGAGVAGWLVRRPPRHDVVRAVVAAALVAAVLWAQPVAQQLTGDDGNLTAVLDAAQADKASAGMAHAGRAVASVVAAPPWWAPSSFRDFDPEAGLVSGAAAVAGLAVVALLLALAARRQEVRPAALVAGVALVASVLAAASQARGPFGLVAGNYRWLWPVAIFVTGALAVSLARGRHVLVAGAAVVLAAAALVPRSQVLVTRTDEPLLPVAHRLLEQLGTVEGPVAFERGDLFFGEPYSYVLLAGLQDRGVEFDVVDDLDVHRFGTARRAVAGEPIITLRSGDDAVDVDPPEARVAFATTFTEEERRELRRLRRRGGDAERLAALEERWRRETIAVVVRPS